MAELASLHPILETTLIGANTALRRPGLVERILRAGAVCGVIAPPGYGKTALATQLLEARPGARLIPAREVATLGNVPAAPLLAVDDAHQLDRPDVDRLLSWAASHDVEQVVFIGRPALEAVLRHALGDRRIELIRANRLGFERDEARTFLTTRIVGDVPEEIVHELHALTAGWPALLDCVVPAGTTERELYAMLQRDEPPAAATRLVTGALLAELTPHEQSLLATASVLRRLEPAAVASVLGDEVAASSLLQRLRDCDLLASGSDGAPRLRAPWVREALRKDAERQSPEKVRRAQLAAAEYLRISGPEWCIPDVIAHYVEAGDWERAAAYLDEHADVLLERVAAERALKWLTSLENHVGALAFRSTCLLARVYAQLGQWHQAQSALQSAQTAMRNLGGQGGAAEAVAFARLAWVQASMALQRGRTSEANAYAQRALTALDEIAPSREAESADPIVFDLLRLQARLMVEAGKHDGAEAVLRQLIDRAERTDRKRAQAIAHFELGKLALRTGDALRAVDHLTSALELVDRQGDSDLYGQLETARAQAHMLRGEYDDARSSISNALSVRRRLGHLPAMARTLVGLGELRVAEGQLDTAEQPFREALDIIRRGADSHLRAEVAIRFASYLVDVKRVGEAIRQLERVKEFVGDLRRFDPALSALAETVRGRIARLQTRMADSQTLLQRAAESLAKQGADHLAAQAFLWLAEAYWSDPPKPDTAAPIRRCGDAACAIANRREYVFGQPERFLPIIGAASSLGSVEATQYLRRISGEVPELRNLEGLSLGEGSKQERFRVFGPDGERVIDAEELGDTLTGMRPEHLAVVSRDGACDIHHRGQVRSGDLKRVVLPLLRALMQHPGEGLSAPDLASVVWGETEFNQKARTRLKVAISRLRELLGADAKHLRTMPGSGPDRSANTRYALDTSLAFLWVEVDE